MAKSRGIANATRLLRADAGFDLATFDPGSTPGFSGTAEDAAAYMEANADRLADLQEMLYAQSRSGGTQSILLVLQGMDTAGKGGIVRHVMGLVDPQGVALRSFGVPTAEERKHHYLWRIRRALPTPGRIGVFDRSHYEDVLVVRVENLVPESVWSKRYAEINRFETQIAERDIHLIKCALMVSYDKQTERLGERLDRPDKHWKFNPGDIDVREKWPAYQEAYQAVFDQTSTSQAPWHIIPADNKWYARLAVFELLLEALESMNLSWPLADFDVDEQKQRLAATADPAWLVRPVVLDAAEAEVVAAAKQRSETTSTDVAAGSKAAKKDAGAKSGKKGSKKADNKTDASSNKKDNASSNKKKSAPKAGKKSGGKKSKKS